MPRKSRTRRILKWVGLGVCVLILIVWCLNTTVLRSELLFVEYFGRSNYLCIYQGTIEWVVPDANPAERRGWQINDVPGYPFVSRMHRVGFLLPDIDLAPNGTRFVLIPLWLPFLLVALPTGYLFWRDRRRIPPGHCQSCGYNLFANVSGICPECGEPCKSDAGEAVP